MNKADIVTALRRQLEKEIEACTRFARDAAEAATHEDNRAEGEKDMRSTEASYLARGQAARVHELENARAQLGALTLTDLSASTIRVFALVELDLEGETRWVFLVPAAGGRKVELDGCTVLTLSPRTPLGSALIGLETGDEAEVPTPQGARSYEVVSVQ